MVDKYLLSSESVSEGHPDKVADQISDAVLDAILAKDPNGRVACEVLCTTGLVLIAGEISTNCYIDIPKVARQVLKDIGYVDPKFGFDYESCSIVVSLDEQSTDIAQGVDITNEREEGAGDQGMMYGYACDETPELMPMPIMMAHGLTKKLAEIRKKKVLKYLGPDSKSQVTVEYEKGVPKRIHTILLATQHLPSAEVETIRTDLMKYVVQPVCGKMMDKDTKVLVNTTGRFVKGGPAADTGLTGRKIIADTYGGIGKHGGGAFSGKDPSKVDRSAAYMARHIAKNVVAAGIAEKCEVQLAYAIGIADPLSVFVTSFGTGKIDDSELTELVKKNFPLKPKEIIDYFGLKAPIYLKTATYGHFGRLEFPWEKTNKADILKRAL